MNEDGSYQMFNKKKDEQEEQIKTFFLLKFKCKRCSKVLNEEICILLEHRKDCTHTHGANRKELSKIRKTIESIFSLN